MGVWYDTVWLGLWAFGFSLSRIPPAYGLFSFRCLKEGSSHRCHVFFHSESIVLSWIVCVSLSACRVVFSEIRINVL